MKTKSLLDMFKEMPEPRKGNGIRHKLEDVLVIAVLALLSDCRTYVDMEIFAKVREEWLRTFLELPGGPPSHDTFGDILCALDPAMLHLAFQEWTDTVRQKLSGEVIAIDGKTIRRSKDTANGKRPLHVVSAWANENQLVLGQLAVEEKSNEITAIPELLNLLYIKGCIVTIDAMGTQKEIASTIIERGGDYVLQVKDNQKTLKEDIAYFLEQEVATQPKAELQAAGQYAQSRTKNHGRIETRTCYTTEEIGWLTCKEEWTHLAGIGLLVFERLMGEQKTRETSYFIYSQKGATAEQLLTAKRSHWGIENKLHWVLDNIMREDDSRARMGHSAENLNTLRHLALNLVKQDTSLKGSQRVKLKMCGLDYKYLLQLFQISNSI
ncbi:ISAs1 family transposase [Paenibacillus albidus]|uniref:ISAs1 family transposase n=1 Tax=Paenibacillus albidus TaxID=2041023 RepID=UPI001BE7C550|nr:ISAs1 family transposase [Paenibacillus albidus]MBT2292440.1 ISAs1 family transposase [Paenibacillus albidus]